MPSMTPADRAQAIRLRAATLLQPQSSCADTPTDFAHQQPATVAIASANFCVHYVAPGSLFAGTDATQPSWAQTTSTTLEHVFAYETGTLGYRHPLDDGDHLTDVTLGDIGSSGYYGACAPASNAVKTEASCVLDNDFSPNQFPGPTSSLGDLEVTAAHEFFHAIQFGYNAHQDEWLLEGSAVWMEDQVYPSVNDYLQYVWGGGAIVNPRTPIDTNAQSQWYAATLFWKFLSESRHDPSIVKQVWNLASTYVSRTALQDVVSALAARGLSFRSEFGLFGVWNTLPPRTYVDRSRYPAPAYWARAHLTRSRRDTGWRKVVLNHLTNASMIVRPGSAMPRRTRVRLSVNAPPAPLGWATVQVRLHNGQVFVYNIALNVQGDGSKVVTFNPRQVASVVLIATNASTHNSNNRNFLLRARALL
ncbi:MAG: hypothetical protein JWQ32_3476 [Marmoricola sp.]|nr:hypothetical protein [Marmoricola sp.]